MFLVALFGSVMRLGRKENILKKEERQHLLQYTNIGELENELVDEDFLQKEKQVYWTLSLQNVKFFVCFAVFLAFLLGGAVIFSLLESPADQETIIAVRNARLQFLTKYPGVKDSDLEELIVEVVKAANRGVSAARNVSGEPNWSFGQSVFFSTTVLTTIGYGHVTPLSREGKLFCVSYALVGIPFTLVILSAFVLRLQVPSTMLLMALNKTFGHLYKPIYIKVIHLCIIGFSVFLFFMIVPAAVFANIEPEWDFADAFYYCFISLTTIGLGDYIPGDAPDQPYRPLYKITTTVYLFLGMIFMMLMLSTFYEIPQLNMGRLFMVEQDDEKVKLADTEVGLQYGTESSHRRKVVTVRPKRNDSPSSDDSTIGDKK